VRFVVDAQLPPQLARSITAMGHQSWHVGDLGLLAADDQRIADKARELDAVIVTKDADFIAMKTVAAARAPRVVHLRIGNCGTVELLRLCAAAWPRIVAALNNGEHIVIVSRPE
jgi:predicted nuclease of predicted toxin-antitoxin system